jgi:hypothetical protein
MSKMTIDELVQKLSAGAFLKVRVLSLLAPDHIPGAASSDEVWNELVELGVVTHVLAPTADVLFSMDSEIHAMVQETVVIRSVSYMATPGVTAARKAAWKALDAACGLVTDGLRRRFLLWEKHAHVLANRGYFSPPRADAMYDLLLKGMNRRGENREMLPLINMLENRAPNHAMPKTLLQWRVTALEAIGCGDRRLRDAKLDMLTPDEQRQAAAHEELKFPPPVYRRPETYCVKNDPGYHC